MLKSYLKRLQDENSVLASGVSEAMNKYKTLELQTVDGIDKLFANEANFFVTNADFSYDDNLTVNMFLFCGNVKVYADPPSMVIGSSNQNGFGYIPKNEWDDKLKELKINPDVIRIIKWKLLEKTPVNF